MTIPPTLSMPSRIFDLDNEYVQRKFDEYNALIFESCLPPIPVRLSRARTYMGKLQYTKKRKVLGSGFACSNFLLRISTSFDLPENEQDDVIIHEMIHYYIAFTGKRDTSTHGKLFRSMMADINARFGRHITISRKVVVGQSGDGSSPFRNRAPRVHHVCISLLRDGSYGVTVAAKTRIGYISRLLPRFYPVHRKVWIESADSFFDRFPRSISPKMYRISASDAEKFIGHQRAD